MNKRSRSAGALTISPNALSFASLRGHVSMTRPPCSTSVRTTASTCAGPRSAISVTGRVDPNPTIGSVSFVPGIARAGIERPCAVLARGASATADANASSLRRVIDCSTPQE